MTAPSRHSGVQQRPDLGDLVGLVPYLILVCCVIEAVLWSIRTVGQHSVHDLDRAKTAPSPITGIGLVIAPASNITAKK